MTINNETFHAFAFPKQMMIADDGSLQPCTWDGEPLWSPASVREGLFDSSAFEQIPGQTAFEEAPVKFWGEMRRDTAELARALDELATAGDIMGWRPASDFESRSLWRVVVRLPGCEQQLTEDGAWTLVTNSRELRP